MADKIIENNQVSMMEKLQQDLHSAIRYLVKAFI